MNWETVILAAMAAVQAVALAYFARNVGRTTSSRSTTSSTTSSAPAPQETEVAE